MDTELIYAVLFLKKDWSISLCMELLRENNINYMSYDSSEYFHTFNIISRVVDSQKNLILHQISESVYLLIDE
jgi:hypothetical protein